MAAERGRVGRDAKLAHKEVAKESPIMSPAQFPVGTELTNGGYKAKRVWQEQLAWATTREAQSRANS